MDYCGIDCSADDIDGHSLRQVTADDKTPTPHDVIHFDFNNQWAVRQDEWKLIYNAIDVKPNDKNTTIQGLFLSNLAIDSTESVNLAEKYPEKVKQLQQLRNEYTSKLNKK